MSSCGIRARTFIRAGVGYVQVFGVNLWRDCCLARQSCCEYVIRCRECFGDGVADAAGAAGDEGGLVDIVEHDSGDQPRRSV